MSMLDVLKGFMLAVIDVGFSGLGFSVGAYVAVLSGAWQWSLRVSQQSAYIVFFFFFSLSQSYTA